VHNIDTIISDVLVNFNFLDDIFYLEDVTSIVNNFMDL